MLCFACVRISSQKHTLAVLRKLLGKTQKEMSTLVECSVPTIQAIELGKLKLSQKLAERIEFKTDVSVAWLLDDNIAIPPKNRAGNDYTIQDFEETQAVFLRPRSDSSRPEITGDWLLCLFGFRVQLQLLAFVAEKAYKAGRTPMLTYKGVNAMRELLREFGQVTKEEQDALNSDMSLKTNVGAKAEWLAAWKEESLKIVNIVLSFLANMEAEFAKNTKLTSKMKPFPIDEMRKLVTRLLGQARDRESLNFHDHRAESRK